DVFGKGGSGVIDPSDRRGDDVGAGANLVAGSLGRISPR
ncbi:MAG: hypothetical protein ACJA1L_002055, partial [Paracoccaceae bacterium]